MHAPLSVVGGIDLRMGTRDAGLGRRLAVRDRRDAPAWQALLGTHGPLAVLPLACAGLAGGDDLHSRTTSATEALAEQLRKRGSTRLAEAVAATPAYFLTLWMAACALILRAAEAGDRPTLVTRAGGNGERFAIGLANAASTWIAVDAVPPSGRITATDSAAATVCGAIGDSAVIDILGLGALAMAGAPEVLMGFDGYLPAHHAALAGELLAADHPVLGRPVALDAARVTATGEAAAGRPRHARRRRSRRPARARPLGRRWRSLRQRSPEPLASPVSTPLRSTPRARGPPPPVEARSWDATCRCTRSCPSHAFLPRGAFC